MLSRVDNIAEDSSGTTKYAQYSYFGAGAIFKTAHPSVTGGLNLNYDTAGDHTYAGLDRFGRVVDQKWARDDTSRFGEYRYGYDQAGNRQYRENAFHSSFSEYYTYDGLNRLTDMQRGTLNGTKTGITGTPGNESAYTLDKVGNWTNYITKTSGTTDLNQTRYHDKANEIAGNSGNPITETTGSAWVDPAYDADGNMTTGPTPGSETTTNTYVYDAWNRLVKVKDNSSNVIATYDYNGLGWRVRKELGAGSSNNGDVYDYYYNFTWQVIEVDKTPSGGSSYTYKQYVWGRRYIDAPVCRFRDTNADGTLDETLYYTEDANFNVTGLVNTSGSIVERYAYSPYGNVKIYDGSWGSRSSSSYDNDVLFAGYRLDTESGLYQVRHRMCNPSLGRWMQRDASGYVDGLSLYGFDRTNPVINADFSGLSAARDNCIKQAKERRDDAIRAAKNRRKDRLEIIKKDLNRIDQESRDALDEYHQTVQQAIDTEHQSRAAALKAFSARIHEIASDTQVALLSATAVAVAAGAPENPVADIGYAAAVAAIMRHAHEADADARRDRDTKISNARQTELRAIRNAKAKRDRILRRLIKEVGADINEEQQINEDYNNDVAYAKNQYEKDKANCPCNK